MNRLPTPAIENTSHSLVGPLSLACSVLHQILLWSIVLILATLNIGSRLLLHTVRLAVRFTFSILIYLIIIALMIGAVIIMLGFHSLNVLNGNFP